MAKQNLIQMKHGYGTPNYTSLDPGELAYSIDEHILYTKDGPILGEGRLDKFYPIGSIYISVVNESPATLFGGTWVRLPENCMLVGANETFPVFQDLNQCGGNESIAHTHDIGTHTHTSSHNHTVSHGHSPASSAHAQFQYTGQPGFIMHTKTATSWTANKRWKSSSGAGSSQSSRDNGISFFIFNGTGVGIFYESTWSNKSLTIPASEKTTSSSTIDPYPTRYSVIMWRRVS